MTLAVTTPDFVIQQLQWRYATKKFDSTRQIPDRVWHLLEQSLVLAPSSYGLQPWKFFVVRNPETRRQLAEHSWGQSQIIDASHLVVLAIKKDLSAADVDRHIGRVSEVRQIPVESLQSLAGVIKGHLAQPPIPPQEWAARQVYIALGQFMTCAAMLGVDTCPMEGFIPAKYDEVLGLNERGYAAAVVCTAGYRAEDDKYATLPKVRFPVEEVVQHMD
jgi:nitroreductase